MEFGEGGKDEMGTCRRRRGPSCELTDHEIGVFSSVSGYQPSNSRQQGDVTAALKNGEFGFKAELGSVRGRAQMCHR